MSRDSGYMFDMPFSNCNVPLFHCFKISIFQYYNVPPQKTKFAAPKSRSSPLPTFSTTTNLNN